MPHSTFQESLLQGLQGRCPLLDSWIRLLGMAPSAGIMGPDGIRWQVWDQWDVPRCEKPPGEIAQNVLEPVANGQSFKMFWPLKG